MSWAAIAGGSKGIGIHIARALAKRKYNLLLVARNPVELAESKSSLEKEFLIQVETIACDLSLPESANLVFDFCDSRKLDVHVLCNAAGLGGSTDFPDLALNDLRTMIRTNIESSMALCLLFIPLLKKNAPSYILNIGSMAGFAPIPVKNIYSSSKSALLFFSYSLKQQVKDDKISVSCLCPGPVFTRPSIEKETIKQLGWLGKQMAVTAATVGEVAVKGMLRRKMIIVPGRLAAMVSFLLRISPRRLITHIFYSFRKQE
jgi:short-subunit dehydrogenase